MVTGPQWVNKKTEGGNKPFFDRKAKKILAAGQSPPQELEGGPCSETCLLVVTYRLCQPRGQYSENQGSFIDPNKDRINITSLDPDINCKKFKI